MCAFFITKEGTTTTRATDRDGNAEPSSRTLEFARELREAIVAGGPWETRVSSIHLLDQQGKELRVLGHYVITPEPAEGNHPHQVRVCFHLVPPYASDSDGASPDIFVNMFIRRNHNSVRFFEFNLQLHWDNEADKDAARLTLKEWCKDGGDGVKHFQGVIAAGRMESGISMEDHITGLLLLCHPS
jgi:hypothetical protein